MAPYRLSLSALLIGLSFSQPALPLGFGDLQLQSQLNQPLQAEIPILGVPAYAADSIRIRLGKREDFAALGYDYLPEIDDVRTELQVRDNRLVLQLTSRRALREPLLNLVLVAEEGSTRYMRDYALLLDLPGTAVASVPAPLVAAPVSEPAAAVATSESIPSEPLQSNSNKEPTTDFATATTAVNTAQPNVAAATSSSNSITTTTAIETLYGPTRPGESLSTISHRLGKARGDEWHAFGVALYHANPEAFIAGDPNRLKMAMPLKIPSAADVQRYHRRDWVALFAGDAAPTASVAQSAPALPVDTTNATSITAVAPPAVATSQTTSTAKPATIAGVAATGGISLQQLQSENLSLKTDLNAATARLQALELQLSQMDLRYSELMQRETSATDTAPASDSGQTETAQTTTGQTEPTATEAVPAESVAANEPVATAPVTVRINDTLAAAAKADAALTAVGQAPLEDVVPAPAAQPWRGVIWGLLTVFALSIAGVLFWQWSERRQQVRTVRNKPHAPRQPRPVLPLADSDESAQAPIDDKSPDRRSLKLKQVQAALETYVSYQRFDRALEMLEQEMHIAGDDLMLRRQLQRLQKQVRHEQSEWQHTHKEQLSEQFDRATMTHVDKPATRDDGKKTSG